MNMRFIRIYCKATDVNFDCLGFQILICIQFELQGGKVDLIAMNFGGKVLMLLGLSFFLSSRKMIVCWWLQRTLRRSAWEDLRQDLQSTWTRDLLMFSAVQSERLPFSFGSHTLPVWTGRGHYRFRSWWETQMDGWRIKYCLSKLHQLYAI